MKHYGPIVPLAKQNSSLLETFDVAVSAIVEHLKEQTGLTDERFKELAAVQKEKKMAEADVEEDLRSGRVVVNKEAEEHDIVCIDFKGKMDGVYFEGGEARTFNVALDNKGFIPGFLGQIVGMRAGEEKTIKVTFPEKYQPKMDFSNKEAEFEIKVRAVKMHVNALFDAYMNKKSEEYEQSNKEQHICQFCGVSRDVYESWVKRTEAAAKANEEAENKEKSNELKE
jgi:hypothetical protein